MNDIFSPLRLSAGSHKAGSGRGCAMNVISWENGDTVITDYPECSDRALSRIVQGVNDFLADEGGFLSPENSKIALDLGHATVGTAYHGLDDLGLKKVYVRLAVFAAKKALYLTQGPHAFIAIQTAEEWLENPSPTTAAAAARAASYAAGAADAADAAAYAAADAADAAAYAADAAAYAARAASYAARAASYAAGRENFRVELAWGLISLFKELTGTSSKSPESEIVESAIQKMLVVS